MQFWLEVKSKRLKFAMFSDDMHAKELELAWTDLAVKLCCTGVPA